MAPSPAGVAFCAERGTSRYRKTRKGWRRLRGGDSAGCASATSSRRGVRLGPRPVFRAALRQPLREHLLGQRDPVTPHEAVRRRLLQERFVGPLDRDPDAHERSADRYDGQAEEHIPHGRPVGAMIWPQMDTCASIRARARPLRLAQSYPFVQLSRAVRLYRALLGSCFDHPRLHQTVTALGFPRTGRSAGSKVAS